MNRSPLRTLLTTAALFCALAASATAFAHAGLVKAVPAAGSKVSSAPKIELTFNETLVPRASRVTLRQVGTDGKLTVIEHVETSVAEGNKTVHATPKHPLGPGEYEVEWRVVGADNHPITGRHRFVIH